MNTPIEKNRNNNKSNSLTDSDISTPKIQGQKESGIPKLVETNIYKCQVCQKEF